MPTPGDRNCKPDWRKPRGANPVPVLPGSPRGSSLLPLPYFTFGRGRLSFPGVILGLFIQRIFVSISCDELFIKLIEGARIGYVYSSMC